MDTIVKAHVQNNGHVLLDIPTKYKNSDVEVLVVINPIKKKYSFSDIIGKLEWKGEPVKEQRKIRNEW